MVQLLKLDTNVSMQTADGLISHKICANNDIEAILGRFSPWEVPHAGK